MGYEVEVKYRVDDTSDLMRRLSALGAVAAQEIEQQDTYLSHPSRDFAQTNEALRIRRTGLTNRVTYKGPRQAGPTKTREEIEIEFSEGTPAYEQLLRIFTNLGFRPVAVIRKRRRPFRLGYEDHEVEVVLDSAEGLGEFAEVETYAATDESIASAQAAVLHVSKTLGLTEVEPRSYLRMTLEAGPR